MAKRVGKFELPNRLIKVEETASDTFASFEAEPFESGYGHTIGNSLRRILLSSIDGGAISSFKMDGIQHEFQSVENICEDVTDIVLNLKKVLLNCHKREPVTLTLDIEKEGPITAGEISPNADIEIINPDQVILTLDKKMQIFAEFEVTVGRGFCVAEDNKKEDQAIGVIAIDSLFSPVTRVQYKVENTRVGKITDYDKLILDIWTDGRITPDDALKEATAILRHHLDVFDKVSTEEIDFESEAKEVSEEQNRLRNLLNMSVNEIELSVRAANCLNNANITTVGELAMKSEQEMLKYRNFGKKSLTELEELVDVKGLNFGMDLSKYKLDKD